MEFLLLLGALFVGQLAFSGSEDEAEDQTLEGTEGEDDTLTGGDGDDLLLGNAGDADSLIGGAGDDTFFLADDNIASGGEVADEFNVRVLEGGSGGTGSVIEDFDRENDRLVVEYSGVGSLELYLNADGDGLVLADTDFNDTLVELPGVSLADGEILEMTYRDPDDNSETNVQFARPTETVPEYIGPMEGTAAADHLIGTDGDDWIFAQGQSAYSAGTDTVEGRAGDDHLFSGSDELYNGYRDHAAGLAFFVNEHYPVTLDGGSGDDTLWFGDSDTATGGDGADVFNVFASETDASNTPAQITDFAPGEDRLDIHFTLTEAGVWYPSLTTAEALSGFALSYDSAADTTSIMIGSWSIATLDGDQTSATVALVDRASDPSNPAWLDSDGNTISEAEGETADIRLVAQDEEAIYGEWS